ncbi:hypothetical protein AB0A76_24425 [Streptomyces exfoliatus]|uniref:Uncharacterized protein n=1 Tax=Streptomyces exfoliatus TaxID=1905 RepID=A0ABV3D1J8_STREX
MLGSWRQDFPHYLETHHVSLPERFLEHVRSLSFQVPTTTVAPGRLGIGCPVAIGCDPHSYLSHEQ